MNNHQHLPDFLVLGAAKAGTTALFEAICRHDRVFKPAVKEPSYLAYAKKKPDFKGPGSERLNRYIVSSFTDYFSLFNNCPTGSIAGDFSTGYLANKQAPLNAKEIVPDAKLIAVLRHPVDRAFSMYLHLAHIGREPSDCFEAAWADSAKRAEAHWRYDMNYQYPGFYAQHLKRWLECFRREQLLILLYEDWRDRPADVLTQVCSHLSLDPLEQPRVTRENVSSRQPHWAWLHHHMTDQDNPLRRLAQRTLPLWARDAVTKGIGALNLRPGPRLDPMLRAKLAITYHDDLTQLEALTGRDLTHWRT